MVISARVCYKGSMNQVSLTDKEIRQLIDDYKPSQATIATLDQKGLVIFVGMTGVGKNTLMNSLIETGKYRDAITSTTRAPRKNDGVMEVEGVDYYFLSLNQAIDNLRSGSYAEVSWVHDRVNGMLASELTKPGFDDQITITDVDIQGAIKYHSLSDRVSLFFVLPPSFEEWDRRNRSRYNSQQDFEEAWPVRRRSSIMELEMALAEAERFKFIINDQLDDTVRSVRTAIEDDESSARDLDEARHLAEDILAKLQAS